MTKPIEPNSKTSPAAPTPTKTVTTAAAPAASPPLPKTWSEIRVGSLVIAHESPADGWWEAVVTEVHADVLTLRWRDYPRMAAITRNRKEELAHSGVTKSEFRQVHAVLGLAVQLTKLLVRAGNEVCFSRGGKRRRRPHSHPKRDPRGRLLLLSASPLSSIASVTMKSLMSRLFETRALIASTMLICDRNRLAQCITCGPSCIPLLYAANCAKCSGNGYSCRSIPRYLSLRGVSWAVSACSLSNGK